jgi:predicted hydrocarbon binding protein
MTELKWSGELGRKGHQVMLLGESIAMHCHHYNINLQKTVEDHLGAEGVRLLAKAAETASYSAFRSLLKQYPRVTTAKSKLEMASVMFQNCGLGILHFHSIRSGGGLIVSPSNHHVTGWLAKHGRRETAGCHFVRGWIAGALEAIYRQPLGHYAVEETGCKMKRDPECVFEVKGG